MESLDTFIMLPLQLDPSSKAISLPSPTHQITNELSHLNALHRAMVTSLDAPANGVPPPPVPVNPKRSAQIAKLRETGNAALKAGKPDDAIRLYTLGLDMAIQRPVWEASGLVREELSTLYGNRAQARMGKTEWAAAAVDAECAVELKKVGNVKGWFRRGRCLLEMGRAEEALEWIREGKEYEGTGPDKAQLGELEGLEREALAKLGR